MSLADSVATGGQCDGLLIVHGHAREGLAHVLGGAQRIGIAAHAFRIDVDQAHLHGGKRVLQAGAVLALALVAGGAEPFLLRTPVDVLLGMPDILAPEGEAVGLQTHRFIGDITGEDHQIRPGDLVAVFLLDRPEQTARLVEIDVVGPGIEGRKALVAGAAAAATIGDAVGAGSMPGHADHQTAVMAPIGRPPFLAVGHQRLEVLLQGRDVELPDLFTIVETLQRVRLGVMLVQDVEIERIGPPIHHRGAGRGQGPVHDRTFAARRLVDTIHLSSSSAGSGATALDRTDSRRDYADRDIVRGNALRPVSKSS